MKVILHLILLVVTGMASAQQKPDTLASLNLPVSDDFKIDQYGQVYLLQQDQLLKLNAKGERMYSFSDPLLGEIEDIDVFDPLALYLFYKNATRLVVLDNRLNESARLDFNELGFYDVQLLSFSDQDNVWFYDQATDKIHRYNLRLQRATNQSLNISQIVGEENTPSGMVSSVNRVYLNIPTQGVYVFNATGALLKVLAIRQVSDFQIQDGKLFALQEGIVNIYSLQTGQPLPYSYGSGELKALEFADRKLYLYNGQQLKVYRFSQAR